MVPKKDSKEKQYIIDYCPLNNVTRKDVTPLPNLKQCIENLQGMELFSKFDICWGYNNIHIQEGDQWKATFKTHQGLFEPKVMFFGMSNSPASFQCFMNGILEELFKHFEQKGIHNIQHMIQNYMDDCGLGTLLKDIQSLKKPSQCFAILERVTWNKSNKLSNIVKIMYVILHHLGFRKYPGSCDLDQK